jgi:hypothetical protein
VAAVLVAGGLGTWTAIAADEGTLIRANATAGALAVALLIVALALRVAIAVPVAVALLGAGYLALLGFETDSLDARAPLVAAALFAVAELAYWSLELRGAVADERGSYLRRLALLAAMLAGVTVLGVALLAVVESVEAGGVAADLLGAGAAVGVLTLLALSARRTAQ